MTPIINPWWFFWIGLADRIGTATGVFAGILFVALVIIVSCKFYLIKEYVRNREDTGELKKAMKPYTNWQVFCLVFGLIFWIISTFLPNSTTLTRMAIAQNITYERLNKALELGKDVHETIKQDIIDVLDGLSKEDTVITRKIK